MCSEIKVRRQHKTLWGPAEWVPWFPSLSSVPEYVLTVCTQGCPPMCRHSGEPVAYVEASRSLRWGCCWGVYYARYRPLQDTSSPGILWAGWVCRAGTLQQQIWVDRDPSGHQRWAQRSSQAHPGGVSAWIQITGHHFAVSPPITSGPDRCKGWYVMWPLADYMAVTAAGVQVIRALSSVDINSVLAWAHRLCKLGVDMGRRLLSVHLGEVARPRARVVSSHRLRLCPWWLGPQLSSWQLL